LSISTSLANARTAALSGNNGSQQIKDQIVQTLTEAGGKVDYVEVILEAFLLAFQSEKYFVVIEFSICQFLFAILTCHL
jgi:pantothenate synthetase